MSVGTPPRPQLPHGGARSQVSHGKEHPCETDLDHFIQLQKPASFQISEDIVQPVFSTDVFAKYEL